MQNSNFIAHNNTQKASLEDHIDSYTKRGIDIPPNIRDACVSHIQDTIAEALKYIDENVISRINTKMSWLNADTLIFGDIHGELRLFIQSLFIAGAIDIDGNYKKENMKNIVQLGDIIDREGKHPFESVIYIRYLQKQARDAGGDLHLLFGNHEKFNLQREEWWNENHFTDTNSNTIIMRPTIKEILTQDITDGIVKLSYSPSNTKLMCFHGRVSKDTIIEIIAHMAKEDIYKNKIHSSPDLKNFFQSVSQAIEIKDFCKKFSSLEIYSKLQKSGIELNDISNWINHQLVKYIKNPENTDISFLIEENEGVYNRNKCQNKNPIIDIDFSRYNKKYDYKPIQVGGHTPTTTSDEGRRAKGFGNGIIQDRASIFADADLCNGYQAFVAADTSNGNLYAVEVLNQEESGKSYMLKDSLKSNRPKDDFCYIPQKLDYIHCRQLKGLDISLTMKKRTLKKVLPNEI